MTKKARTLIVPMKQPKTTPAKQKLVGPRRGTRNMGMSTGDGTLPAWSPLLQLHVLTWGFTASRYSFKGQNIENVLPLSVVDIGLMYMSKATRDLSEIRSVTSAQGRNRGSHIGGTQICFLGNTEILCKWSPDHCAKH